MEWRGTEKQIKWARALPRSYRQEVLRKAPATTIEGKNLIEEWSNAYCDKLEDSDSAKMWIESSYDHKTMEPVDGKKHDPKFIIRDAIKLEQTVRSIAEKAREIQTSVRQMLPRPSV